MSGLFPPHHRFSIPIRIDVGFALVDEGRGIFDRRGRSRHERHGHIHGPTDLMHECLHVLDPRLFRPSFVPLFVDGRLPDLEGVLLEADVGVVELADRASRSGGGVVHRGVGRRHREIRPVGGGFVHRGRFADLLGFGEPLGHVGRQVVVVAAGDA